MSATTLWLAGFGAAGAWTVAFLAIIATGSTSCIAFNNRVPRFAGAWWVLAAITAASFVAAGWSLVITLRVSRASESPDAHRVRFMAFGGLLLNVLFVIGFVFDALALLLAPMCV